METFEVVARVFLAAVFGLAGVTKLADRAGSVQSMAAFGIPSTLAPAAAAVLPVVELVCAIALIPATTARWGALGVLLLLLLFVVAIAVSLARGRAPDCHCFGQLHSAPVGWNTVARNLVLAGVSGFVLQQLSGGSPRSIVSLVSDSARPMSLSSALAFAAMVLAASALYVVFQVLRQNGRLLVRIEALETRVGTAASAPASGLAVGAEAPAFSLPDLEGRNLTMEAVGNSKKPLLLLFSEPGCGACDQLLPDISAWQREHGDRFTTVVISRGTAAQNRNKQAKYALKDVFLQRDREIAEAYRVAGSPSAVLVEDGRIARETAVGTGAVRSLVSSLTAVRLSAGAPVPSLPLIDLNGELVDFSQRRGRRTHLLFWNPTCGFCQQMLDDVKTWEQSVASESAELIVISSGSVELNEAQGLRSRVLLDPEFKAQELFGVTGTPAAVVLDQHGRLASTIAVGRAPVLAQLRPVSHV